MLGRDAPHNDHDLATALPALLGIVLIIAWGGSRGQVEKADLEIKDVCLGQNTTAQANAQSAGMSSVSACATGPFPSQLSRREGQAHPIMVA